MQFLKFEITRRLCQPMVYIFTLVNFALIFGALNNSTVNVGEPLPNVNLNAPWVVQNQVLLMTIIGLLITTAFMNTAAIRDFTSKFDGILFTKPISKLSYLGGRFFGAVTMACIPFFGVLFAVYLSGFDLFGGAKVGETYWAAYFWALVLIIIPNTLFTGAVTFSVAVLTRSQILGFLAALGLLVAYIVSGSLFSNLDTEFLGAMLDPFGFQVFAMETKYWTIEEQNTQYLTLANSTFFINRIIWIIISLSIATFTYFRFSFEEKATRKKEKIVTTENLSTQTLIQPVLTSTSVSSLSTLFYQVKTELKAALTSRTFIVIIIFGIFNMSGSIFNVDESYGTGNYPVTYLMVDAIRGSLYLFLAAIVMYYAGEMVWREREAKIDELFDASPIATWIAPTAKFIGLCLLVLTVLITAVFLGVGIQAIKGYTNFEIWQYVSQLLILDWLIFIGFGALALFIQALVNNKYLGYFIFLVVALIATFGMGALEVNNNLFIFGSSPSVTVTAFNGMEPFTNGSIAFSAYWLLFSLVLIAGAALLWVRGRGHSLRNRFALTGSRFSGGQAYFSMGMAALFLGTGGFIYYQTEIVNENLGEEDIYELKEAYELNFKRFSDLPMPTITAIDYNIDIYPTDRRMEVLGTISVQNQTSEPIDSLLLSLPSDFTIEVDVPGAELIPSKSARSAKVYAFAKPLAAGDSLVLTSRAKYEAKGIENEVSNLDVVPNGTFVNNRAFAPRIGYEKDMQIADIAERRKRGLPKMNRIGKLPQGACHKACSHTYLGNDSHWINLSSTVTTSSDQLAIAPGILVSETTDESNGRTTRRYQVDSPVMNYFSVVSGRYTVQREQWKDVSLEVYHLAEHAYNVDKMMASMRTSLEYYTSQFGPYPHKQARIIEFPRYANFAQAFPGTMPYSESLGFIADHNDSTDIDLVTYVVAHEMAHQWWAHQVIGAEVQGATMLSETFAQYSAFMVQEQFYGRANMRKFMAYERDRYLRGRGKELLAERPLMLDEVQGYVHYNKGAVIMYALAEYIGRDSLNAALKSFYDEYAFAFDPYPTSRDFIEGHLRARVPDSLQYMIKDGFEEITFYDNRAVSASAKTLADGRYELTFDVHVEKVYADSLGKTIPTTVNGDYMDVAFYGEKPSGGDQYALGKVIWKERMRFDTDGDHSITVRVDELPAKAGIDAELLLIDRHDKDNITAVTLLDK